MAARQGKKDTKKKIKRKNGMGGSVCVVIRKMHCISATQSKCWQLNYALCFSLTHFPGANA